MDDTYARFTNRYDELVDKQKGFNLCMILGEAYKKLNHDFQRTRKFDGQFTLKAEWLPMFQFGFEWINITTVRQLETEHALSRRVAQFLKNGNKDSNDEIVFIENAMSVLRLIEKIKDFFNKIEYENEINANERMAPSRMRDALENRDGMEYISELIFTRFPKDTHEEILEHGFFSIQADYMLWKSYIWHVSRVYNEELKMSRREKETYNERINNIKQVEKTYTIIIERTEQYEKWMAYMEKRIAPNIYGNKINMTGGV